MSSRVDEEYMRQLEARGPMFGMAQCAGALKDVFSMLRLQVTRERPELSAAQLEIATARRLYWGDAGAQRLLDLACERHRE